MKRIQKIKEVCTISGGYAFKSNDFTRQGIPIIRIGDISGNKVNISSGTVFFEEYNEKLNKFIIEKGDILVALSGATTGKFGIYDEEIQALLNQRVAKISPKENINNKYLYHYMNKLQNIIYNKALGCAQPNISPNEIGEIEIYVPSRLEQDKISDVLDIAKDLIDKRKKQIEELDLLVKSKFIEMFGDPINNPMKWEVKKMKDISVNIMSGNTPKGGEQVYVESGIMFLRSQNVWKNKLLLDDVAYIDQATHNKMKKSSLKNKDILMTKTGRINTENSSLGRAAMFLGEDDSANINGHVYLIRLQEQIINEFVLYILTSKEYRGYIRSVCVGGIDKRQLNKEHIEDFPIIFPPIEKQKKFVSYVNQVDKLKFEMEKSLKELKNNFNSLIQKAFNGELV
ncbi:restriction endonuclease subunit S [Clostridium perfringens]|uniref:restriction endonuclease subunit S n=1 Tax=Clostridium perfringens TaxID=1502 RepID=UPI00399D5132|nr:restriction endonuclease subunit S [Clostridium perfringens]